jgi:hypothetical protein
MAFFDTSDLFKFWVKGAVDGKESSIVNDPVQYKNVSLRDLNDMEVRHEDEARVGLLHDQE